MINEIEPARLSEEEHEFLLAHVGEPPIVAFKGSNLNPGQIAAVKPIIESVHELITLEQHDGAKWCGVEAVKEGIRVYLRETRKCLEQAQRLRNKAQRVMAQSPSMYTIDGKGKFHWAGPGSDSDFPRTYFTKDGKRKVFKIELFPSFAEDYVPYWVEGAVKEVPKELIEDPEKNRIECAICAHTESYRSESASSYNAAKARMSKHLKKPKSEPEMHQEYHTNVFGS